MESQPGANFPANPADPDLTPLAVVKVSDAGGWAVVNVDTLKVVEPGYCWSKRASAIRWALDELERERREETEYRRRQDEPVERGLSRSWAALQSESRQRPAGAT